MKVFVLFALLLLLGCQTENKKTSSPVAVKIPPMGGWSKLLLSSQDTHRRLQAIQELLKNHKLSFPPFRLKKISSSQEAPWQYYHLQGILTYPGTSQGALASAFSKTALKQFQKRFSENEWTHLENLFQTLQIAFMLGKIYLLELHITTSQLSSSLTEQAAQFALGVLQYLKKQDPYLKYLTPRLFSLLRKVSSEKPSSPWSLLSRRESPSFEEVLQKFHKLYQKAKHQLQWIFPHHEVRTIYTHSSTSSLSSPKNISHVAVHPSGTVFFSEGKKIYFISQEGNAKILWSLPEKHNLSEFHFDHFGTLYFLSPPWLRTVDLEERKVKNYPLPSLFFSTLSPQFGRFPFCLTPKGEIYILQPLHKTIYLFQLDPSSTSLKLLEKIPYQGNLASLAFSQGKLYASDPERHLILRWNPLAKQWEIVGGKANHKGHLDGAAGLLDSPFGLFPAQNGVWIADQGSHSLRLLRQNRLFTLAGFLRGNLDGNVKQARLERPITVSQSREDVVFFGEKHTFTIRGVGPKGWKYLPKLPIVLENVDDLFLKSQSLASQGKTRKALALLQKFFQKTPFHTNLYKARLLRAKLLLKEKLQDLALEDCHQAIQLLPQRDEGYLLRAEIFRQKGRLDLAKKDWQQVVQLYRTSSARKQCESPGYLKAKVYLIQAALEEKNYKEAEKLAHQFYSFLRSANLAYGISLTPWIQKVLRLRAAIWEKQSQWKKALAEYDRLLEYQKTLSLLQKKAEILWRMRETKKALSLAKNLFARYPLSPSLAKLLGDIYYSQSSSKALEYYQTYLELGGKDPEVSQRLNTLIQGKLRSKEYIDIKVRQGGKTYIIRYYTDGRKEKIEVE